MKNSDLFAAAKKYIPGGVNSPVRAFAGVGGTPIFIDHASGAYLYDSEGKRYIDYVGSWGPMILGHAQPDIIRAVQQAAEHGLSFGAPTALETRMANWLCTHLPSMAQVRMVNSGTEATMSAVRLARGYTGRDTIIKFEGCYHGHADSFLIKAGSGALTLGIPTSPGVPAALAAHTITLPFNDSAAVRAAFAKYGEQLAAVIVEPIAGNMNFIPPLPEFLPCLRELCDQYGTVLIFDEVMTGFRVGLQGAQGLYGVSPDLTTLGKVIGGGLPVGAFGGKAEIMAQLAPLGPVYQAGTLSGNPIAMTAGLATLEKLAAPGFFEQLTAKTESLMTGLQALAKKHQIPLLSQFAGGMFGIFFTGQSSVSTFNDVQKCNLEQFKQFFHGMLQRGVYLAPSAYEAGFISIAHSTADIEETLTAADQVLSELKVEHA